MATPRYCTVDQVIESLAIGAEVDEDNLAANAAGLDEDRLERCIASAANDIDSSLWAVYNVPFDSTSPPGLVNEMTVAIAAWHATRTNLDDDPLPDDSPVQRGYSWARQRLIDIVAGKAGLPGVPRISRDANGDVVDTSSGTGGRAGRPRNPHERLFTADSLMSAGSWRAPPDRPWLDARW